ncbi:hypothetical protein N1F89_08345 [Aquibium sp. A9E412]|uniref:hypothetical protein n=1 Tax=Aquibium sp. A9E412 TaxID=2976767 RepID=UPI0025B04DFA|nr:hypothetical protein [Aquibium sp. A9E412]MDN2566228.1 hypothetical protein [Aquibium sp. A9E412]
MAPFAVVSALWGLATVAALIAAIRLCYRIERRSGRYPPASRLPAYANLLPVAFNRGVAADAETQALRRRMNRLLMAILAGFVLFAGLVVRLMPSGQ